jgi:DNA-binding transcriptional MocR family regulator
LIYALRPRARRVYTALRATILSGERIPGDKLPSHLNLAVEYGVAPLTLRQVLAQLEARACYRGSTAAAPLFEQPPHRPYSSWMMSR